MLVFGLVYPNGDSIVWTHSTNSKGYGIGFFFKHLTAIILETSTVKTSLWEVHSSWPIRWKTCFQQLTSTGNQQVVDIPLLCLTYWSVGHQAMCQKCAKNVAKTELWSRLSRLEWSLPRIQWGWEKMGKFGPVKRVLKGEASSHT